MLAFPGTHEKRQFLNTGTLTPGGLGVVEDRGEEFQRFQAYLHYGAMLTRFQEEDNNDTDDQRVDGVLQFNLKSGLTFEVLNLYLDGHDEYGEGAFGDLDTYKSNLTGGRVTYDLSSKFRVRGEYSHFTVNYDADANQYLDRADDKYSGYLYYKLSGKSTIFAEYDLVDIGYDQFADIDSSEQTVWGGLRWRLSGKSIGEVKVGYLTKDNSLADAYKEEVMAIQMDSSGYALKWMTKKAEEERASLAKAEKALQQYMKQHDIVTVEDKVTILPQQLSELTSKLANAQAQKNVVANIYRQIEEVKAAKGDVESLPTIANHKGLQDIRESARKAEQEVSELSGKFGHKHPTMIEARGKLNDIVRQKNAEISKIINSVKNEYEVAQAQEATLRSALAGVKGETQVLNEKMTEYNVLKRDVDTNRALYDALVLQTKEKGVTENTQKVNVWMTQVALTPLDPIKPKKMRNILLGLVLGLFGGVGCAFFVEYLDNTIKDPEEAERRFGMSVVGVIELLKKGQNPDVFVNEEPASSFAESYKSLRTAILLSSADRPPKRLMITSMSPQEGKTTTSLNLARALAQTERKVLLIDADQRRPRIHKAFGLNNSAGLSSYLSGTVQDLPVQGTDEPFLSVLTSGPIPPNPSELLGSQRFELLLEKLEQQFDMIIIDSPPVLSATDSLLISKLAESVVIVCRTGVTTYDRLQRGLKSIREINPHVLGLVLNAMDMKKSNYYSYYGYYQYFSASKEA